MTARGVTESGTKTNHFDLEFKPDDRDLGTQHNLLAIRLNRQDGADLVFESDVR